MTSPEIAVLSSTRILRAPEDRMPASYRTATEITQQIDAALINYQPDTAGLASQLTELQLQIAQLRLDVESTTTEFTYAQAPAGSVFERSVRRWCAT